MNFANEKVKEAWLQGRDDALRGMSIRERLSAYRKPEEIKAYSMGFAYGVQMKCEQTIREIERA